MGRPAPDRELSAFETLMVAGEEDPRTRSAFVVAFTLEGTPDPERTVKSFEFLSRRVPRFRQRAVLPALAVGAGRWVVDPDFDLGYHLRFSTLAGPGTFRQVLDAVEVLLMSPLDRARPLWEAQVLTGLEGGGSVLLLKFHHAMFDGLGGLEATAYLFQTEPNHPIPPLSPLPGPQDLSPQQVARDALRRLPFAMAGGLTRGTVGAGGALWRVARRPRVAPATVAGWGHSAAEWGRAVSEVFGSAPTASSPLLRGRGPLRRVLTLDVEVDDLKRAGKAAGGSLNDAYLAAVAGAIGRYHERLGAPVETFLLAMPVSLRTEGDPGASNRWSPARISAPASQGDPCQRIVQIHDLVVAARDRAALNVVGRVSPLVTFVPRWALPALSSHAARIDVQASNVPGWAGGDLWFAGTKVGRAHPFGPLPGVAAMVTLLSLNGTCYIGVTYDPAAITDPVAFADCLRQGFEEIRSVADPVTSSSLRPKSRRGPRRTRRGNAA